MNAAVMAETNRAKLAGLLQPDNEKAQELEGLTDHQLRLRLNAALSALGIRPGAQDVHDADVGGEDAAKSST